MLPTRITRFLVGSILLLALMPALPAAAQTPAVTTIHQFGTPGNDDARPVAVDGDGYVYVAGYTPGVLRGQTSAGGNDALVRQYLPNGSEGWTRQFGSSDDDFAYGLAVDSNGNV